MRSLRPFLLDKAFWRKALSWAALWVCLHPLSAQLDSSYLVRDETQPSDPILENIWVDSLGTLSLWMMQATMQDGPSLLDQFTLLIEQNSTKTYFIGGTPLPRSLAQADTARVDSPPPVRIGIKKGGRPPDRDSTFSLDSLAGIPSWMMIDTTAPKPTLKQRISRYYEANGPRLITNEKEKTRLYFRIPGRDSVTLPFPIGLLPAPKPPPFNPAIAWQRSALIPGWGQAYNRSYLQIPIFYAGYIGIGWWLNFNNQQYIRYGSAYLCVAVSNGVGCEVPADIVGDAEGIRSQRNSFRQTRDNAVLILVGWHSLQVVEAFVRAHLKEFDVGEDLTTQVEFAPINTYGMASFGPGVRITF